MTVQITLLYDAGLVRPRAGSLGLVYGSALLGGCIAALIIGAMFEPTSTVDLGALFALVIWQPVLEEMLFRGVVQGYLLQSRVAAYRWGPLSAPNLMASGAFAAIHFVAHPPIWALLTFLPSLVFGVFRERSGSIWPAVVLHGCYNGAFFAPAALGLVS